MSFERFVVNVLREVFSPMVTKEDLRLGFAKLREVIAQEKGEAVESVKSAVAEAVKPLEAAIAELKQQLADASVPQDLADVAAELEAAISEVKEIVTQPTVDPELPTDEAPEGA